MTHKPVTFTAILALAATLTSISHASDLPGNVAWGDSLADAGGKLARHCKATRTISVDPPSFPLAESSEQHFICRDFGFGAVNVDAMAFVFADDKLVMLETRGGAAAAFGAADNEEVRDYLHYRIMNDLEKFVDSKNDAVWFLSKPALHPNLFTWSNPFLATTGEPTRLYDPSAATPDMLAFGGKLDDLRASYETSCPLLAIEGDQRVWLPHKPSSQTQVNCFGFEYAGFPRKIEAVFGDGELEVVWILTGESEEDRVRQALIAAFGEPEFVSKKWELFAGKRVALRKDKPEVLMISEKMLPYYESDFEEE